MSMRENNERFIWRGKRVYSAQNLENFVVLLGLLLRWHNNFASASYAVAVTWSDANEDSSRTKLWYASANAF